jgi:hypothetical protein
MTPIRHNYDYGITYRQALRINWQEAWGAAFAGGPVALAYAHFDTPTRQDAHAEYLAAIEPYRQGSGYAIPGEFVITSGRKL